MSKVNISKEALVLAHKRADYKINPIKFIEECVKIPTPGESELLKLYEPQKKIIASFFKNHKLILLKSRQIGMSTLCQAIITYIFTFYDNCVVGIISRDGPESSDFCRKVQFMIDELPEWIRPQYKNKSVQYFILENGCQLHTAAVSPVNPGAVFRSKSITFLVIDEAAHIRNVDEAWTGIAPALSKVQQVAGQKGIPYGTMVLSTPNKVEGIGKWYFTMWTSARKKQNAFKAHKIHWKEIPCFADDPNWYKEQCKMLNNDPNRIAQELELQFVGSANSLFQEDVQRSLQQCFKNPEEVVMLPSVMRGKGELWRFKNISRANFHIIGIDCAGASGTDKCAIEVIEYETMEQVMEFHGKLDPKEFVDVVRIVAAHCPHNILIIDATGGYGQTVCYDLLYDETTNYNIYGELKGSTATKKFEPGLKITSKNRPLIVDALHDYVSNDPDIIYSERLASELLGLTNKGDRVEADAGFNDDLALAYAYCCFIRKYHMEEILPHIESIPDELADSMFSQNNVSSILGINAPTSLAASVKGLLYDSENKERETVENEMREEVDRFVSEQIASGNMSGFVDMFSVMYGDDRGLF